MSIINRIKNLPDPIFILFITSKILVLIGIAILFAKYLAGFGWWFILLGVITSLPISFYLLKQK